MQKIYTLTTIIATYIIFVLFAKSAFADASISISKSFNETTAFPGDIVNVTLNVTNNGTVGFDSPPLLVYDTLPLGISYNGSASPSTSAIDNQTLYWELGGGLGSGNSQIITFLVTIDNNDKPGNLTNYANAAGSYCISNCGGSPQIGVAVHSQTYENITINNKSILATPTLSFPFFNIACCFPCFNFFVLFDSNKSHLW